MASNRITRAAASRGTVDDSSVNQITAVRFFCLSRLLARYTAFLQRDIAHLPFCEGLSQTAGFHRRGREVKLRAVRRPAVTKNHRAGRIRTLEFSRG
jgi:hypothetical protein